ncbi:MAG: AAA family ATPase [Lachnospiraceae bacterium]|nr:AAA family ATPase [Lachnospiraceae bacterium]
MILDEISEKVMHQALMLAARVGSEYVTPEHIMYAATEVPLFQRTVKMMEGNINDLRNNLTEFINDKIPKRKDLSDTNMENRISDSFASTIEIAVETARESDEDKVRLDHIIWGISQQNESFAIFYLVSEVGNIEEFLNTMQLLARGIEEKDYKDNDDFTDNPEEFILDYADVLNEKVKNRDELIGRDKEIDRMIRILLRREKNNPILIGEPGVGKTSIVYGLARRINEGLVPDALKGSKIYRLDVAELLAGTQYRGDFELRFKELMDAFGEMDSPIVFIDEIHSIIGAGQMGNGSSDVSSMLKPYLEEGKIRFIGTTTYSDYRRYLEKNTTLVRRFQNIDVKEPDEEETVKILEGLRPGYEKFHGVKYAKDALPYAVRLSRNFIGGRFLPDKAIDLIDEAGAYRRMHPIDGQKRQTVGKDVIETVLSEIGNIPKATAEQSEVDRLKDLYGRITAKIFGQDEAVHKIVDAILMSRAGLVADNKPIASFLFVGPTGVGKTEVAKVLASELGIGFVRFDMSEYMEKHTVSKLIGSPAGYVGYEDGGLLTDAINKTPNCVLLLDEIEKAHPDIYNVLLQVMDYASLTDSRGKKADFKNVIIIMTSNAGARLIGKQSIGFGAQTFNDGVMMEEVKRVFSPEFRNRLSAIVSFNHMSEKMAGQITQKKLDELIVKLTAKNIKITVDQKAVSYIRSKGITREYGAREIERVIDTQIKPLFVSEILFGKLRNGGKAVLTTGVDETSKRSNAEKGRVKKSGKTDTERLSVKKADRSSDKPLLIVEKAKVAVRKKQEDKV